MATPGDGASSRALPQVALRRARPDEFDEIVRLVNAAYAVECDGGVLSFKKRGVNRIHTEDQRAGLRAAIKEQRAIVAVKEAAAKEVEEALEEMFGEAPAGAAAGASATTSLVGVAVYSLRTTTTVPAATAATAATATFEIENDDDGDEGPPAAAGPTARHQEGAATAPPTAGGAAAPSPPLPAPTRSGTILYFGPIAVDPAAQGQGIGVALLTELERVAAAVPTTGPRLLEMSVVSHRIDLIPYYKRRGFAVVAHRLLSEALCVGEQGDLDPSRPGGLEIFMQKLLLLP